MGRSKKGGEHEGVTKDESRARSRRHLRVRLRHTDLKPEDKWTSLRGFKMESDMS